MSCSLLLSVWMFPALGQTVSRIAEPGAAKATALSGQVFHCYTGYPLSQCQKDILQLNSILTHYPIDRLGDWTWVLVRSEDWKPICRVLRLKPVSPAFTALDLRETFLEEALFVHHPERTAELMKEWQRSMPQLLELAVSHELGHALCGETNEAAADRFGEELRNGLSPRCQLPKQARKKSVAAGETNRLKANAFRAP